MGEVFSWENEVEYASVVGGAGPAGPRRKFKIAVYGQNIVITIQKKPPGSNRVKENRPGILLSPPGPYPYASD